MRQKFAKLFIYFGLVHLIFVLIHFIYDFNGMKIFKIGKSALADISFNDFHYREVHSKIKHDGKNDYLLHYKDHKYPKEVCLVNIADLPDSNFRSEFIHLIERLQGFGPKVVGVDITFDSSLPLSKEIQELGTNYSNMVWAQKNKNDLAGKIDFGPQNMGFTRLITDTKTIRKYSSSTKSFANRLVRKAYPKIKIKPLDDEVFNIHYNSLENGMVRYDLVNDPLIEYNYHYIPASDIMDTSMMDMNILMSLDSELKDMVVIVGYLGQEGRRSYDVEDKWCTPTDVNNMVQRDPLMYGSVIHANAFNNILHEDSRYAEWSGWPFVLITNLLLLGFIAFLIFFHYPKIVNIALVTLLTLPMLYLAVKFMEYGIYISVGATVLHIIVIEEIVEVIDPFYNAISKRFKLIFKR
ncbi:CHASE2 domain-containing protein [Crocinitomicaceae bacterium]|nr:CHASE2 domain-containing protein [Crocinitomicaceae bacterium]